MSPKYGDDHLNLCQSPLSFSTIKQVKIKSYRKINLKNPTIIFLTEMKSNIYYEVNVCYNHFMYMKHKQFFLSDQSVKEPNSVQITEIIN